jgi:hypothetical protein
MKATIDVVVKFLLNCVVLIHKHCTAWLHVRLLTQSAELSVLKVKQMACFIETPLMKYSEAIHGKRDPS